MRTQLLTAVLTAGTFFGTARAQDNALLYEVSGNGLKQPSYLYGTFHLVCPTDLAITDAIKKAMDGTQQVYLELDMDDPAMMTGMMKAMMLPDGKSVRDYLSADDYTLLETYFRERLKMNLASMSRMRPFGLMSMMYVTLLKCQPVSYDMTFARMAGKEKKEVLGLESLEAQLSVLDSTPIEEQLKGLVDMARKPDEASKEFEALLNAYKAHDLSKLFEQMKTSQFSGSDPAMFERNIESLLNKRNANWIPVIEKAASQKPTFFAFGAGHLISDKGVVNLLRKKGYTVRGIE